MQHPNKPSSVKPLSVIVHLWEQAARGVVSSLCKTAMVPEAGIGFGTCRMYHKKPIGSVASQLSIFTNVLQYGTPDNPISRRSNGADRVPDVGGPV
jgi:hypothetical protein